MAEAMTIGKYLIQRLEERGLKHVFGIPGDYVLGFFDLLTRSSLTTVGTCTEAGAGFAGDAYARVNGVVPPWTAAEQADAAKKEMK